MNINIVKMNDVPEELLSLGEIKYFKKNEIIIHQGDMLNYIYILLKGKILAFINSNDGSIRYDSILLPPYIIGESHTICKKESIASFRALENIKVVKISRDTLISTMKIDFNIMIYLYNITNTNFEISVKNTLNNTTLSSEKLIINFLIELVKEIGIEIDNKIKIDIDISHQFISNFLGVNRVTVFRTFDKLKNENIIEYHDGYYYIKNLELLNSHS